MDTHLFRIHSFKSQGAEITTTTSPLIIRFDRSDRGDQFTNTNSKMKIYFTSELIIISATFIIVLYNSDTSICHFKFLSWTRRPDADIVRSKQVARMNV